MVLGFDIIKENFNHFILKFIKLHDNFLSWCFLILNTREYKLVNKIINIFEQKIIIHISSIFFCL